MKLLRFVSLFAIVVALPLAAAPWWWPNVVGGQRAWSDAQANEYSQAAAGFHRLAHDQSNRFSAEAHDVAARYHRNRGALEQARSAGQSTATIMRYLGIAAVAVGMCGWAAAMRPSAPD